MSNNLSPSHKLLARYLEGDKSVTLQDIKNQEKKDNFNYLLNKFSFNKPYLKPLAYPLVLLCTFFED